MLALNGRVEILIGEAATTLAPLEAGIMDIRVRRWRMAQKILDMPRLSSDNVLPEKSGRLPALDSS